MVPAGPLGVFFGVIVIFLVRDALLSIGAAALIFFTRSAEYGVIYPIYLLGTVHTYGAIGLSLSVLIAGLFGAAASQEQAMGINQVAFAPGGSGPVPEPTSATREPSSK